MNTTEAGVCELCGRTTNEIIMHHVRKLKELKGNTEWERKMIDIRRKSLAVCPECFNVIQNQVQLVDGEPDTPRGVRPVREGEG